MDSRTPTRTRAERIARRAHRRTLRSALRQRATTTRAAARIRRRGEGSLVTHAIAAGLPVREARSMVRTLRDKAADLGVTGREARCHAGRCMRTTHRYTPAEVAVICGIYKPRKAAFKTAKARLVRAAMAVAA